MQVSPGRSSRRGAALDHSLGAIEEFLAGRTTNDNYPGRVD